MKKIMLAGAVLCLPAAAFCDDECSCELTPGFAATVSVGLGVGGTPCDVEENYGKTTFLQMHQIERGKPQFGADNGNAESVETLVQEFERGNSGYLSDLKSTEDAVTVDNVHEGLNYMAKKVSTSKLRRDAKVHSTNLCAKLGLGAVYVCENGFSAGLQLNANLSDANAKRCHSPGLTGDSLLDQELKSNKLGMSADLIFGYTKGKWTAFIGGGAAWGKTQLTTDLRYTEQGNDASLIKTHLKQKKVRPEIVLGTKARLCENTQLVTTFSYVFPKSKRADYGTQIVGLTDTIRLWVRGDDTDAICRDQATCTANRDEYVVEDVPFKNELVFVSDPGSVKLKQKGAFSVSVAAEYSFPFSGM